MAKKKGPVKLNNLLKKGRERFKVESDPEQSTYDFLKERESIVSKIEKNQKSNLNSKIEPQLIENESITELEKTDNKKITNGNQTDYSLDNKWSPKGKQSDNNQIAKGEQKDIQTEIRTDNKLGNKTSPLPVVEFCDHYDYRELIGNEKRILYHVFHECLREGELHTPKIRVSSIADATNISLGTAKMSIKRLKDKRLLSVVKQKAGRSGWAIYGISKELHKMLQSDDFFTDIEHKRVTKQGTKQITNSSSSSSRILKEKNLTTTLPDKWITILIPEPIKKIGFSKHHLRQLYSKGRLEAEEVQDSLEHFAYDLEKENIHASTGPLNLLMGTLNKNNAERPYVSDGFMAKLRDEVEETRRKRKELEEFKKFQKEQELVRKFEDWRDSLSQEQINEIVPPNEVLKEGSTYQMMALRNKFEEGEL